jgi:hypothetical protein
LEPTFEAGSLSVVWSASCTHYLQTTVGDMSFDIRKFVAGERKPAAAEVVDANRAVDPKIQEAPAEP